MGHRLSKIYTRTGDASFRYSTLRIARSSGYAVLDSSALSALRRVEYLKEAPLWLNGHAIEIELPVIFRLEDD